jgi:peptidoglycan hydrolase-like protein with peptidoglycan-binding domain
MIEWHSRGASPLGGAKYLQPNRFGIHPTRCGRIPSSKPFAIASFDHCNGAERPWIQLGLSTAPFAELIEVAYTAAETSNSNKSMQGNTMNRRLLQALVIAGILLPGVGSADELTQIIQQDLATLGYDPGNTDGEASVATVVAISKFQAEHDLDVTGEASPQLAGVIKAAISQQGQGGSQAAAATAPSSAARDPAELQAAQQACLQNKIAEAQQAQQRKRGFAKLARAVTRTASRLGGDDISNDVSALSSAAYDANAIAGDLQGAAEDLGLTETDIEECRNPT